MQGGRIHVRIIEKERQAVYQFVVLKVVIKMNFSSYLSFFKQNANWELDPTLKRIHKADDDKQKNCWISGPRSLAGLFSAVNPSLK